MMALSAMPENVLGLPEWSPQAICGLLAVAAFCCLVLGLGHLDMWLMERDRERKER
jgi:hypothetical protein